MLCRIFETEENYELCAEAKNGREATDLALKCRPELIILDFSMPVMNGMDAARELKKLMPDAARPHGNNLEEEEIKKKEEKREKRKNT
jgi:YesN/AraC family two-component response regulator